ncbi:MAG: preprotein translocase subunit SecE [Bacilli bacterium]|nr:preprotein translocase subunit SecE [Bacilli bacterium]
MKSEKEKKVKEKEAKVVEAEIVEKEADTKEKKTKKKEKVKADKKKEKTEKTKIKTNKKEGFFKEVIKELKKVKWPDKKYMVKYSAATFGTIIISSLYFYVIFALFSYIKGLI